MTWSRRGYYLVWHPVLGMVHRAVNPPGEPSLGNLMENSVGLGRDFVDTAKKVVWQGEDGELAVLKEPCGLDGCTVTYPHPKLLGTLA